MTPRSRLLILSTLLVLLVAAVGWSVWRALQVRDELVAAQDAVTRLQATLGQEGTDAERDRAVADLTAAAAEARDLTSGAGWSALTWLPLAGDDAEAVQGLSDSLAQVAEDGLPPLLAVSDRLPDVQAKGRVDLAVVEDMQRPVTQAHEAFAAASERVDGIESDGLAGAVRGRFDDYAAEISQAAAALDDAEQTVAALPAVLGADGPRQYLLVFQNNAEIRPTGGLPGSWSLVRAEDGALSILRQGAGSDFEVRPTLPLTKDERRLYGAKMGSYFLNSGFTPDFPRAAELMTAHFERAYPDSPVDGVVALDPVTLSYLLEGTGPVTVGPVELTTDNAIEQLLDVPYRTLEPEQQDLFFAAAAKAVFDSATRDAGDPLALVQALRRATAEGRLLMSVDDEAVMDVVDGTRLEGELSGDDGSTPHVDITLNDATGSKMSYYLRYNADVEARSCQDGRQQLSATMALRQTINQEQAAQLDDYITGGGNFGVEEGRQFVEVLIYAPYGGTLEQLRLDGRRLPLPPTDYEGRLVAEVAVELTNQKPARITWEMETGPSQTGDVELGMTPSVVPGDNNAVVDNAC
jgi:hypothetical protein